MLSVGCFHVCRSWELLVLWQHLRCGCDALQIASAAAVSSDRAALPSEQLALKAVPSWCQYVPAEYRPVACRGSSPSGCICASFCKDTAADSWSNNPNRSTNDRMRAEHYASGFCAFVFGCGSGSRKHRLCLGRLLVLGTGLTVGTPDKANERFGLISPLGLIVALVSS